LLDALLLGKHFLQQSRPFQPLLQKLWKKTDTFFLLESTSLFRFSQALNPYLFIEYN